MYKFTGFTEKIRSNVVTSIIMHSLTRIIPFAWQQILFQEDKFATPIFDSDVSWRNWPKRRQHWSPLTANSYQVLNRSYSHDLVDARFPKEIRNSGNYGVSHETFGNWIILLCQGGIPGTRLEYHLTQVPVSERDHSSVEIGNWHI